MSDEIPDLLYSDAERALSDALASLLADRGGLDKALARIESAQTYDDKLWQAVGADLGCAGLLIPERRRRGRRVLPGGRGRRRGAGQLRRAGAVPRQRGRGHRGPAERRLRGRTTAGQDGGRRRDHGAGGPVRQRAGIGLPGLGPGGRAAARRRRDRGGAAARDGRRGRRRAARRGAAGPGRRRAAGALPGRHGRRGRGQGAGDLARHDQAAVRPVVRRRAGHADRVRARPPRGRWTRRWPPGPASWPPNRPGWPSAAWT